MEFIFLKQKGEKMKTGVLTAVILMAGGAFVFGDTLINESFSGNTVPSGWVFNGKESANHNSLATGVNKANSDWFVNENGTNFLRLTERTTNQRTTAIYTNSTFRSDRSFTIRSDIRVTSPTGNNGADGISFFWLKADTVTNVNTTIGGMGGWQGAPRGAITGTAGSGNTLSEAGYYSGLKGYSFEFDHYNNSGEQYIEYNHLVRLEDWVHIPGAAINHSANPNFYEDNGWQTIQFAYNSDLDNFTVSWGFNGSTFSSNVTYSVGTEKFDQAYFGISAGTGGQIAAQDVRNITFTGVIPEPASVMMIALGSFVIAGYRRFFGRV
jgi:hypothetical protein